MRTSLDLTDHLFTLAKQRATAQNISLKAVIEEALRRYLIPSKSTEGRVQEVSAPYHVPLLPGKGGMQAGLETLSSGELLEYADSNPAEVKV